MNSPFDEELAPAPKTPSYSNLATNCPDKVAEGRIQAKEQPPVRPFTSRPPPTLAQPDLHLLTTSGQEQGGRGGGGLGDWDKGHVEAELRGRGGEK